MSNSVGPLFTPFSVKSVVLRNRIVMAPMTRARSPGGVPGPKVAEYYRKRAEHGVGLIITEGTGIDHPAALGNPNVPYFHGGESLAGWAAVVDAVHAAGGRIMPQLWHVGTARNPGSEPNPQAPPVGPSGLTGAGERVGAPLTEREIAGLVDAYAKGAADAARLGFDGIELHGAHGYLIDQFFWARTNERTDRYGGDLVARTRFAVEVVQACRRATRPDFPIVLRFSQWKAAQYDAKLATTPQELEAWLRPLVDAGVDVFHCSTRRFWEPEFAGSALNLAGWTKKLSGKPAITVGSVGLDIDFLSSMHDGQEAGRAGIERLIQMVENEEVDLAAIGRALLADAAWAEKLRDARTEEQILFTTAALATLA